MKKLQSRYLFDRCVLLILALGILALLLLVALTVYIAEEPWAIWAVLGGAALLGAQSILATGGSIFPSVKPKRCWSSSWTGIP